MATVWIRINAKQPPSRLAPWQTPKDLHELLQRAFALASQFSDQPTSMAVGRGNIFNLAKTCMPFMRPGHTVVGENFEHIRSRSVCFQVQLVLRWHLSVFLHEFECIGAFHEVVNFEPVISHLQLFAGSSWTLVPRWAYEGFYIVGW